MKCVILAAGEGLRMRPLTIENPKPMLKVSGKPLLEHVLDALPEKVDELVLVVGYLRNKIRDYFGDQFGRFKISYVAQEEKLGTYHALKLCKPFLGNDEKFLVLYADDLHGKDGLEKCADSPEIALLVSEAENPEKFGVVETSNDGRIIGIEEKPANPKTNLVSTGVLLLDKMVFDYEASRAPNGEYYLTDSLAQMLEAGQKIYAIKSSFWLPIGYPEDLKIAEKQFKKKIDF